MACRPHQWGWPLPQGESLTCSACGRILHVKDTSPNARAAITNSIASRMFEGDEYTEISYIVSDWFIAALSSWYARTGQVRII